MERTLIDYDENKPEPYPPDKKKPTLRIVTHTEYQIALSHPESDLSKRFKDPDTETVYLVLPLGYKAVRSGTKERSFGVLLYHGGFNGSKYSTEVVIPLEKTGIYILDPDTHRLIRL